MKTSAEPGSRARLDWPGGLERDAARDLSTMAVMSLLCALAVRHGTGFGMDYVAKVAAMLGACSWLVWRGLPRSHPHSTLGPANRITLARLGVASLLAAVIGQPAARTNAIAWGIVVIATATALLDLVDGRLARRSGLASDFGARFDMETDAWFTLVLCGLVIFFGKAGPWLLAAGAMRYVFVLAARLWPWLAAPLAPSTRRKAVCVTQITTLIVCLGPIIPATATSALAAASLALLAWSFGVDVRELARARPHVPDAT